jgi:glycosyltransferase involved in cell wall biosynthesis
LNYSADVKEDLEKTVAETWPDGIVKIARSQERLGLIRAKIAGAKMATGDVIVFLDAHCEANAQWLVSEVSCTSYGQINFLSLIILRSFIYFTVTWMPGCLSSTECEALVLCISIIEQLSVIT